MNGAGYLKKYVVILIALAITLFLVTTSCAVNSGKQAPMPNQAFNGTITIDSKLSSMTEHSNKKIEVEVKNTSDVIWPSKGNFPVRLAYHWLNKDRKVIIFDGERTMLPYDLEPNHTVKLYASISSPSVPGNYILQVDLVQEAVSWFEDKGMKPTELNVTIGKKI